MIGHCPDYVEVLKDTITACNNDKLDVKDWAQVQAEKVQRMNAQ